MDAGSISSSNDAGFHTSSRSIGEFSQARSVTSSIASTASSIRMGFAALLNRAMNPVKSKTSTIATANRKLKYQQELTDIRSRNIVRNQHQDLCDIEARNNIDDKWSQIGTMPFQAYSTSNVFPKNSQLKNELDELRMRKIATVVNQRYTATAEGLQKEREVADLALRDIDRRKEELKKQNPISEGARWQFNQTMSMLDQMNLDLKKQKEDLKKKESDTQEMYRRYEANFLPQMEMACQPKQEAIQPDIDQATLAATNINDKIDPSNCDEARRFAKSRDGLAPEDEHVKPDDNWSYKVRWVGSFPGAGDIDDDFDINGDLIEKVHMPGPDDAAGPRIQKQDINSDEIEADIKKEADEYIRIKNESDPGFGMDSDTASSSSVILFDIPTNIHLEMNKERKSRRVCLYILIGILVIIAASIMAISLQESDKEGEVDGVGELSKNFTSLTYLSVSPTTSVESLPLITSSYPTYLPTVSQFPSSLPSSETISPTVGPTRAFTSNPSEGPSPNPTQAFSSNPSEAPSSNPIFTRTHSPTFTPTLSPTVAPTPFPTVVPTPFPTVVPTFFPTVVPTSFPTVVPTSFPTDDPTSSPTVDPTLSPTSAPTPADKVKVTYGDTLFLQVNNVDSRWLSGGRDASREGVITRDLSELKNVLTYEWIARTSPGDGTRNDKDENDGVCVKYGDKMFFQVNNVDSRWLSGGRDASREGVITRDLSELKNVLTYEWIARTSPGDGTRSDKDENDGVCVKYGDKMFFQVNNVDSRWLSGGRKNNNQLVYTDNHLGSDYELEGRPHYEWIVRTSPGDGSRTAKETNEGICVNYGDTLYLQVNNLDNRWLSGGRGNGKEGVGSFDHLGSKEEKNKKRGYEWIMRASPGDGSRP
eukprot:CAMPEP_0194397806 /NCGR_PEP_ID=MMETSP0174-20130528/125751_1 /TAXON_ID=216777 /ORGANISM="Proboscia alata, Strain PI-D3" /LENGTH=874 /DNA_ID=CAMNT_0039194029 /DNA_START=18 /DNA_END=2642 /DNA_ORIENTATION=-